MRTGYKALKSNRLSILYIWPYKINFLIIKLNFIPKIDLITWIIYNKWERKINIEQLLNQKYASY